MPIFKKKRSIFALRLLYAEDDLNIPDVMIRILQRRFKEVVCANDGMEALEKFMQGGIDLMIVDMNMPYMDGLEFCAKVRAVDTQIPIMMVTASRDVSMSGELLDLGIDSLLLKPINTTLLDQELETLVQKVFVSKQALSQGVRP